MSQITQNTFFVFFGNHDKGADDGFFTRETLEIAYRSQKLLSECGYQFTDIRHASSIAEFPFQQ